MNLTRGFQFSQKSLQDFVDCRRRFLLRYIHGISWPALPSEPANESELRLMRGAQFHHYLHQHSTGIPYELLSELIKDETLIQWWRAYLQHAWPMIEELGDKYRDSEINLSAPLMGYRLIAKLDLLLVSSAGKVTIVDWKTTSQRPKRRWLQERMQTKVYPYLVARSWDKFFPGEEVHRENIEMIYWFPAFPDQLVRFSYSSEKYNEDEEFLSGIFKEITRLEEAEFFKTNIEARCGFCVYRSLCDRGVGAGEFGELEDDWDGDMEDYVLDFDQIAEIAF